MKLRKTLSVFLAICMINSSVSVAFAEDMPVSTQMLEITEENAEQEISEETSEEKSEETLKETSEEISEEISEESSEEISEETSEETSEEVSEENTELTDFNDKAESIGIEAEEFETAGIETALIEAMQFETEEEAQSEEKTDDINKAKEDIVLTAELDDIIVTLESSADAFNNKGELALKLTPAQMAESEEAALDVVEDENVAKRITYDITVLDDGIEIEPVKEVKILFKLKDAPSGADGVNIYHHDMEDGIEKIAAEVLAEDEVEVALEVNVAEKIAVEDVAVEEATEEETPAADVVFEEATIEETPTTDAAIEQSSILENVTEKATDTEWIESEDEITVEATVDSFSLYTVDFTYEDKTISIDGNTTCNKLDDIVAELGIQEKVEEAITYQDVECTEEVADGEVTENGETLFSVYEIDDTWYVDAVNAFDTEHGLVVKTADGSEYIIKVTDDQQGHNNDDCITFSSDGAFSLYINGEKPWNGIIYYSTDKSSWYEWTGSEISAAQNDGEGKYNLYLYGTAGNTRISNNGTNSYPWILKGEGNTIACSGNIETLRGATGDNPSATEMGENCYFSMFSDCTKLTTAPTLPATKLAEYCYGHMFSGCTSLTTAPVLPADTLAAYCYYEMFKGCESLTAAPNLPANTLATACYNSMFENCTSLTTAPATLPAKTLVTYCYENMFFGCTNLTTAPYIYSTSSLKTSCYKSMFSGCSSLYITTTGSGEIYKICTIPAINATTKIYINNMFYGTKNTEITTPTAKTTYYYVPIESISVSTAPTKTTYTYGETADLTGLKLKITYANGENKDLDYSTTSGITTTTDSLKVSDKTLTITFAGKTTTQAITVNKKSLQ